MSSLWRLYGTSTIVRLGKDRVRLDIKTNVKCQMSNLCVCVCVCVRQVCIRPLDRSSELSSSFFLFGLVCLFDNSCDIRERRKDREDREDRGMLIKGGHRVGLMLQRATRDPVTVQCCLD